MGKTKIIVWLMFAIAFTGTFIKGWSSGDLWGQILIGLLALGSWLGSYAEWKRI